jgi:hypothetical protein
MIKCSACLSGRKPDLFLMVLNGLPALSFLIHGVHPSLFKNISKISFCDNGSKRRAVLSNGLLFDNNTARS